MDSDDPKEEANTTRKSIFANVDKSFLQADIRNGAKTPPANTRTLIKVGLSHSYCWKNPLYTLYTLLFCNNRMFARWKKKINN